MMEQVLSGLRDVQGVIGSFVCDSQGTPLAAALPHFFSRADLTCAGARMISIFEAMAELEAAPQSCTLYFSEHRLYAHLFGGGCLGIIAESSVNVRALRMASRLAQRKLQRLMGTVPDSSSESGRLSYPAHTSSESTLIRNSVAS